MTRFKLRKRNVSPAMLLGLLLATVIAPAIARAAEVSEFQGIKVEVSGTGEPVLMIPGLNSGGEVWRETCQALQPQLQCHVLTLPGFAGQPALPGDAFLAPMRERLLAYIAERRLKRPAVIGHSLGGVLALQMAIAQPQAIGKLVIVDSLPYFAAIQNPAATPTSVAPMAEQMRAGMLAVDAVSYLAQADASVANMAHAPARIDTLKDWGRRSDRRATANAMCDMLLTDLRDQLGALESPTLVLGSWAAYKPMGATEQSTRAIFASQYAKLPGVDIRMSEAGYHFLMWDDAPWLQTQIRSFLAASP